MGILKSYSRCNFCSIGKEKNDLGFHTEIFSDGMMETSQLGVINGSKNTWHEGKIVSIFIMGSKELYAWVVDSA